MAKDNAPKDNAWDRLNPYVSWALGPGRSHFFSGQDRDKDQDKDLLPLLLRLRGDTAQGFLAGIGHESFHVLARRDGPGMTGASTVWAATMANATIRTAIASPAARPSLQSVSLGRPLGAQGLKALATVSKPATRRRARAQAIRAQAMMGASTAPLVVMGIIDDGIAFAHERFRQLAGTTFTSRVEYCWLQGPGIVLDKARIDALLAAHGDDEEVLYRQAGQFDFRSGDHKSAAWRAAHGTHVMDLACGFDPADNRDDRPIVCVQLPVAVTADENPGDLYVWIAFAIDYIVDRARAVAAARGAASFAVVINLSYGLLADPHDGTGDLEAFIEDKIAECRANGFELRVVLPAGNSYLARIHGRLSFPAARPTRTLHWRVLPDDRTPTFLEIWLPAPLPAQSRITLTVTSPTGHSMTTVENGPKARLGTAAGDYAWAYWSPWLPSNRARFIVILQSTAQPDWPVPQLAPAGTWRIELRHTGGLAAGDLVHAWVRRDDHVYGFPLRGRQSYLDDPTYTPLDHAGRDLEADDPASLARREGTINSLATGASTIVMGGYLGKERLPAKYSAAGAAPRQAPPPPPPDLVPRWPDAMAVSEDSRVHAGVLAAGSHSGSVIAMGGTSVAAPQIARRIADDLANGGTGDRATVQAWTTVALPQPERSGAGGIPSTPIVKLKRYDGP